MVSKSDYLILIYLPLVWYEWWIPACCKKSLKASFKFPLMFISLVYFFKSRACAKIIDESFFLLINCVHRENWMLNDSLIWLVLAFSSSLNLSVIINNIKESLSWLISFFCWTQPFFLSFSYLNPIVLMMLYLWFMSPYLFLFALYLLWVL